MNSKNELFEAKVNHAICMNTLEELATGYLRYETLRVLSMRNLVEIQDRCLAGESFDGLIDAIVSAKLHLPSGILWNTTIPNE